MAAFGPPVGAGARLFSTPTERRFLLRGRGLFLTGAVGPGKAVALAVPAFPGGPAGSPGKTVPADFAELFVFVSHPETPRITMRRSGACATW